MKKAMILSKSLIQCSMVEKLLEMGGINFGVSPTYNTLVPEYIYCRRVDDTVMTHPACGCLMNAVQYANDNGYEIFTAKDFLETPEIIDGWKLPEHIPTQGDIYEGGFCGSFYLMDECGEHMRIVSGGKNQSIGIIPQDDSYSDTYRPDLKLVVLYNDCFPANRCYHTPQTGDIYCGISGDFYLINSKHKAIRITSHRTWMPVGKESKRGFQHLTYRPDAKIYVVAK